MKIYNKSNFLLGLFFGLLGIAMLIVGVWHLYGLKVFVLYALSYAWLDIL